MHHENIPAKVVLDLGLEWQELTGYPMVFGVFAARKDTPISTIKKAYDSLLEQLVEFELSNERRKINCRVVIKKFWFTR